MSSTTNGEVSWPWQRPARSSMNRMRSFTCGVTGNPSVATSIGANRSCLRGAFPVSFDSFALIAAMVASICSALATTPQFRSVSKSKAEPPAAVPRIGTREEISATTQFPSQSIATSALGLSVPYAC